jgi:hypothetical protein
MKFADKRTVPPASERSGQSTGRGRVNEPDAEHAQRSVSTYRGTAEHRETGRGLG